MDMRYLISLTTEGSFTLQCPAVAARNAFIAPIPSGFLR